MRLDAWLRQQHSPAERLRLVERLAQALNTVHDRGEMLAALSPERVEIGGEMKVDLGPAQRGQPEPGYSAPEVLEGGPPSTAADIYAAGALCWEILVGRPCGEAPRPLLEVVPDLPRELANSVMGCLEKSPDWRPKDLTYLAQLAAAQQKVGRAPAAADPPPTVSTPARGVPSPARSTAPARNFSPKRESRSQLPLILAAVLLVAAAGASYYFWMRPGGTSPAPRASATPKPTASVVPEVAAAATPEPVATPSATPPPVATAAVAVATPTPPPVRTVATPQPETTLAAAPTPTPVAAPTPQPAAAQQAAAPPEPVAAAVEPASLATVSPLSIKRGGRALLDLRGAGLRSDLHVQILPIKDAPRGISIVRTKWANANLVSVLLELDTNVTPTAYAIALESPNGERTNALHLTVTK